MITTARGKRRGGGWGATLKDARRRGLLQDIAKLPFNAFGGLTRFSERGLDNPYGLAQSALGAAKRDGWTEA